MDVMAVISLRDEGKFESKFTNSHVNMTRRNMLFRKPRKFGTRCTERWIR